MSEKVRALAEAAAKARQVYEAHQMRNAQTDPELALRQHVAYKLAEDAWWAAERAYRAAVSALSVEEMQAIAYPTIQ